MQTSSLLRLALLGLLLSGCMSANTIMIGTSQPRAAVPPDSVRVFMAEADVPGEFEQIAVIEIKADPTYVNQTRMLEEAKRRAGSVGANAVILGEFKDRSLAATLLIGAERKVQVLAVRLTPGTPTTASQPRAAGSLARAGSGSGFFVSANGHLLSNAHVVEECRQVRSSGEVLEVLRVDRGNDLALLRSHRSPNAIAVFREGRQVRAGDAVVAIGFPLTGVLASEANVTLGNVSALAGIYNDLRFLQVTAPVQPGNSGGPLLDDTGHVVGVVTSKLNALQMVRATGDIPQNVNFAINASVARLLLDNLGVPYIEKPSVGVRPPADIADSAKQFTVLLECWK
jgi:S1-C subfamily serine protease